jgi:hypothetical protein
VYKKRVLGEGILSFQYKLRLIWYLKSDTIRIFLLESGGI